MVRQKQQDCKLHQHRPQTAFLISLTILTSNQSKFSRGPSGDKPPNYGGFGSLCQGIRRKTKELRADKTQMEQDPVEGRQRKTNRDRPGNHVGTGCSIGRQMATHLEIMLEEDQVEARQRETNGDRPGHHVGT